VCDLPTLAVKYGRTRAAVNLAPDDLRDTLVAHAHDLGNGRHWQAIVVGPPYGFVSLLTELFGSLLQSCFALGVVLGESSEAGSGLGSLTFRTGDPRIV
jgi:hypothetical protein